MVGRTVPAATRAARRDEGAFDMAPFCRKGTPRARPRRLTFRRSDRTLSSRIAVAEPPQTALTSARSPDYEARLERRPRHLDHKQEAQRAIDEAYGISRRPDTLGEYFATWTDRHSRSERTNDTNEHRISRMRDVDVDGIALKDWPTRDLRRRHALVDHMLRTEVRATTGATGIIRSLSAMAEDAITDEITDLNPFKGVRIRASDSRAKKKPRPIRVFSFDEMHAFAKADGRYSLVRVFADTGLWLGEVLPLRAEDLDGDLPHVRPTAHEGAVLEGTKTDHGEINAGHKVPSIRPWPGCCRPRST